MKKKIAFLMASVMTMTMMPTINSYARSTNSLNGKTASEKTLFYESGITAPKADVNTSKVKYVAEAPYLEIKCDDGIPTGASLELKLDNSKFVFRDYKSYVTAGGTVEHDYDAILNSNYGKLDVTGGVATYTRYGTPDGEVPYTLTNKSDDIAVVQFSKETSYPRDSIVMIPVIARVNEDLTSGDAKLTVTGSSTSRMTNSTHKFATISKGSTRVSVDKVQTGKNKIKVGTIKIEENAAGSMSVADGDGFYLELPSGYYFAGSPQLSFNNFDTTVMNWDARIVSGDTRKAEFKFWNLTHDNSGYKGSIEITGLEIIPNSSSDSITKEDVKASLRRLGNSEMVTEDDITVGTHADYSMNFKAEGTVPTLLNGYYDRDSKANDRAKSVKVVVSEDTAGSIINGGDLVLNISDSAKITAVKIEDIDNVNNLKSGTYYLNETRDGVEVKDSKVTLRGLARPTDTTEKAKFTVSFYLSLESGFVGDVTMKVSGDAIRNNESVEPVVIAKSVNPLNVTVNTVYFTPGQTVEMGDIVLTEQMNSKGESSLEKDKTVTLGFSNNNNYLSVVGTPTVKTENGLTVKDVKVTNTTASGSALSFRIDDASSKNKASKITISGLKVAASASTPEGTYDLLATGTAVGGNSTSIIGSNSDVASFSTDGMTIAKLQYGGKVAMKITIGDKMVNVNGQNVEMKLAPFIDAKTGTTYMQVSDIVKATGKTCTFFDNRIQKVEGMAQTLFVTFGDRTFEKDKSIVKIAGQTIPETMTNEQGQAVNMIIKDDYTCLPLRYFVEKVLGQKINWNGTDNTITVE